ncbi:hypothetical protein B7463_g6416, partial [Scytalidium lignicola]
MPPRPRVSAQHLSALDLPILPFLAPRVFKPWPLIARKSHFTFLELTRHASLRGTVLELQHAHSLGGDNSLPPLIGTEEHDHQLNQSSIKDNHGAHGPPSKSGQEDSIHTGKPRQPIYNGNSQYAADEEFRRRYEEIWGTSRTNKQCHPTTTETDPNDGADNTSSTVWKDVLHANRTQTTSLGENGRKALGNGKDRTQSQASKRKRFGRSLPSTRPKFVRLTPDIGSTEDGFSSFWNRNFALLNLRHHRFMRKGRPTPRAKIVLRNEMSQRLRNELLEGGSISSISKIWQSAPSIDRHHIWPELLLTTLSRYPDSAIKLLTAIYTTPYLPSYAVSDTLDFITCRYLQNRENVDVDTLFSIFEGTLDLIQKAPHGHLELSQNTIYLLLSSLDATRCKALYLALVESSHPLHQNTLMHFTSRLAHLGEIDLAFAALQRLHRLGTDFNSPQMASICTTLLHHESWASDSNAFKATISESDLFEFMLQCGFKPNIITFNVLIQNALHIGDYETAWRIHDMMSENGVDADGFTYSLLLHDAKLYQDEQAIQHIVKLVRQKGLRNAHIITDFLHAIFLLHEGRYRRQSTKYTASATTKEGPDVWSKMCPIYCNYFKLSPLVHLIPNSLSYREILISSASVGGDSTSPPISTIGDSLRDPPVPTLSVMLAGLLNSFTKPRDAKLFYEHFQSLVLAGDPTATSLVQNPHVYNGILLALGQFPENTSTCSRLIGDMLPPKLLSPVKSEDISASSETPKVTVRVPKPDIYTWSILLKVFIDNQQPRAAEKVLSIMQSHNITPSHVTWKSLVSGYARMNDPIMVARTLSRLQDAGIETDEIKQKAMELTKDHTALIAAMRAEKPKLRSARKGKIFKQTFEVLDRAAEFMDEDQKMASDSSPAGTMKTSDSIEPIVR